MDTVMVEPINVSVTNQGGDNISRKSLLDWINETIIHNFNKRENNIEKIEIIEDMSTGVLYCKMINELFHGSIVMGKIKRNPQHAHEKQYNLKQLQNAFHNLGIQKQIDIEKISRGRFQDNFEFLQWFRKFYIVNDHNIKEVTRNESQMMKCRSHRSLQNCRQYSNAEFFKRSRTSPILKKQKSSLQLPKFEYDVDETPHDHGEQETVSALANDLEQYELDYTNANNDIDRKMLERRIYHQILSRIETLLQVQMTRYEVLQKAFEVLANMTVNDNIYLHNCSSFNLGDIEECKYGDVEENNEEY